jgi:hypothetical protein
LSAGSNSGNMASTGGPKQVCINSKWWYLSKRQVTTEISW